jgi:hypothetical protein
VLIFIGVVAIWLFKFIFPFITVVIGWGAGVTAGHASQRLAVEQAQERT